MWSGKRLTCQRRGKKFKAENELYLCPFPAHKLSLGSHSTLWKMNYFIGPELPLLLHSEDSVPVHRLLVTPNSHAFHTLSLLPRRLVCSLQPGILQRSSSETVFFGNLFSNVSRQETFFLLQALVLQPLWSDHTRKDYRWVVSSITS